MEKKKYSNKSKKEFPNRKRLNYKFYKIKLTQCQNSNDTYISKIIGRFLCS